MGRKIEAQLRHGEPILFHTGSPFGRDWPIVAVMLGAFVAFAVSVGRHYEVETYFQFIGLLAIAELAVIVVWNLYLFETAVTDVRLLYKKRSGEIDETPLSSITTVRTDGVMSNVVCGESGTLFLGYLSDPEGLVRALATHGGVQIETLPTKKQQRWCWLFRFCQVLGVVLPFVGYLFLFFYCFGSEAPPGDIGMALFAVCIIIHFFGLARAFFTGILFMMLLLCARLFLTETEARSVMQARCGLAGPANVSAMQMEFDLYPMAERFAGLLYGQRI